MHQRSSALNNRATTPSASSPSIRAVVAGCREGERSRLGQSNAG